MNHRLLAGGPVPSQPPGSPHTRSVSHSPVPNFKGLSLETEIATGDMNALGAESLMVFKTLNRVLDLKKTFVFLRGIAERLPLCMLTGQSGSSWKCLWRLFNSFWQLLHRVFNTLWQIIRGYWQNLGQKMCNLLKIANILWGNWHRDPSTLWHPVIKLAENCQHPEINLPESCCMASGTLAKGYPINIQKRAIFMQYLWKTEKKL